MKDDFLHEFREAPRADFTEALYQQLLEEENNTVSSLSVPLHAINGHHSRQHSPVKTRSLAWIAAILALMLFGSLLVYMVSSGVPHPVTLTQIQTEISLSDLPLITRENVGQLTVVRQMGSGRVTEIAWSPDGNTLAVAGTFGVWLYDTHAWDAPPLLLPLSSDGAERHLAFSPDGTLLASTDDLLIRLWSTGTWSLVATLEDHTNPITQLAFSPDSTLLASGGGDFGVENVENPDYAVRLWDVQSGEVRTMIMSPNGTTRSLAFSPDGSLLAGTCSCDGDAEWVMNIQTGHEARYLVHNGDSHSNPSMVFSPDGTLLAESTLQGINLWDVANGQQVARVKRSEFSPPELQSMAFSPDGSLLAYSGLYDGINLWDTGTQEFLPRSSEQSTLINIDSLTFSPDGTQIATLHNDNSIQIWDTHSGDELAVIQDWHGAVRALVSADGETIIGYAVRDGIISVFDSAESTLRRQWDTGLFSISYHDIGISPDSTTLAYGGRKPAGFLNASPVINGAEINLVNLATGDIQPLGGDSNLTSAFTISPDGTHLAGILPFMSQTLYIWDLTRPETLPTSVEVDLAFDRTVVLTPNDISYAPDGHFLMLEGTAGQLFVVHPDTGDVQGVFERPGDADPTDTRSRDLFAAISPDGSRLATLYNAPYEDSESGSELYIRSMETNTILSTIPVDGYSIADPIFSPDGRLLVVLTSRQMQVLDTESGSVLYQTGTLNSAISSIAFDATGRFVVTGGWDGIIRVWGVMPG